MQFSILLLLPCVLAAPLAERQTKTIARRAIGAFQQCGGQGFSTGDTCAPGTYCKSVNEWWSQCEPSEAGEGQVPLWGQCGGTGYTGPTQCAGGASCVPQEGNQYYSQCLSSAPESNQHSGGQQGEQQQGEQQQGEQQQGEQQQGEQQQGEQQQGE